MASLTGSESRDLSLQTLRMKSSTEFDIEEFDFEWKLNFLNHRTLSGSMEVKSTIFKGGLRGQHSWQICHRRQVHGWKVTYETSLTLLVVGNPSLSTEGGVKAQLFYSCRKDLPLTGELNLQVIKPGGKLYGVEKQVEMFGHCQDKGSVDSDTVYCRIVTFCGFKHSGICRSIPPYNVMGDVDGVSANAVIVVEAIKAALKTDDFADLTLVTPSKKIAAHKFFLAARSPVFASMLKANMKEARTNVIQIPDFKAPVVEAMLEHIYTGKVTQLEENALDLFQISDKYELQQLKTECEFYLCSHLTVENAVACLQLATLHNSRPLKLACLQFIHVNKLKIGETEFFKKVAETDPSLLLDLYLSM